MFLLFSVLCSLALAGSLDEACPEGSLSIKGLDKVQLLKELWVAQEEHGFSKSFPQRWSNEAAVEAVTDYIDYFQGRAIKMDLSEDCIDPVLYDRDTPLHAVHTVKSLRRAKRDEM